MGGFERDRRQMMRYSKQREAIWNYLKERIDHPTADQIYENVRKTQPNISLGTVYRNLMQLRDIGRLVNGRSGRRVDSL